MCVQSKNSKLDSNFDNCQNNCNDPNVWIYSLTQIRSPQQSGHRCPHKSGCITNKVIPKSNYSQSREIGKQVGLAICNANYILYYTQANTARLLVHHWLRSGKGIWHLSQLVSLHCVCIPPSEQPLTGSVGRYAFLPFVLRMWRSSHIAFSHLYQVFCHFFSSDLVTH